MPRVSGPAVDQALAKIGKRFVHPSAMLIIQPSRHGVELDVRCAFIAQCADRPLAGLSDPGLEIFACLLEQRCDRLASSRCSAFHR
jgi:hypothetical protein